MAKKVITSNLKPKKTAVKPTKLVSVQVRRGRPPKAVAKAELKKLPVDSDGWQARFNQLKHSRPAYVLTGVVVVGLLLFLAARYLVVAWVDKRPITRFEYYSAMDKKYGKDIREQLIVQTLVLDEARNRGVSVNEDEINAEIKRIQDSQGGADKLNQVLQVQGIGNDEFRNLIKLQLLRQKLFGNDASVSAQEVDKYIEDNKQSLLASEASSDGTTPTDITDKTRVGVTDQLKQQKVSDVFSKWLNDALQSSRVLRVN